MEGHTDQERRSYKEEESNTVKQHYKPLLFSAVLGPEVLEPSQRRQKPRACPRSTKSESVFLRITSSDSGNTTVNSLTQGHFNCHESSEMVVSIGKVTWCYPLETQYKLESQARGPACRHTDSTQPHLLPLFFSTVGSYLRG